MKTDWTDFWRKNYGGLLWETWKWRIARGYKGLLKATDLTNPKILELGSGSGINSLAMAKILNAKGITLVDFNEKALKTSRKVFKNAGFDVRYLNEDVVKLNLKEKFDLVHSEGLVEHFYGRNRKLAFKKHSDMSKGFVIIFVPFRSAQYDIFRWFWARLGKWIWDEKIFSKEELYELSKSLNLEIIKSYNSPLIHETGILMKKTY